MVPRVYEAPRKGSGAAKNELVPVWDTSGCQGKNLATREFGYKYSACNTRDGIILFIECVINGIHVPGDTTSLCSLQDSHLFNIKC